MREIVLDTETTGLNPEDNHRIVEIACVELVNRLPSGKEYQTYLNPERNIPQEAYDIHGLSEEFLQDFRVFSQVAPEFLEFIDDARLVIHNAEFDVRFLNAELSACHYPVIQADKVIDTLSLARTLFPGMAVNLEALCKRFGIDTKKRDKHGALIDCHLLAAVYLELTGGSQNQFNLSSPSFSPDRTPDLVLPDRGDSSMNEEEMRTRFSRPHTASPAELQAHARMLKRLKNPLWTREEVV